MNCKPLVIGSVVLKNNLIMAPIAGITDLPFRAIAKEGGAGLVCTEMISAKALVHNDARTKKILAVSKDEHPISVQIFGSEPRVMGEASRIAQDAGADIIDINFGCPVPKIVKSGAGIKAVENEKLMADIMESAVKSVNIPVTIKIRIGRDPKENAAPQIVKIAQESGIKMAAIHGRPASSGHSGNVNLEAIACAVQNSMIPIVGNGGIADELSAKHFIDKTGCAGLMIGRAAIGDPEIFARIESYLKTGKVLSSITWEKRIEYLKENAIRSCKFYGEQIGLVRLRKTAPYFLRGLPNSSSIRNKFNYITTLGELDEILSGIWISPYFAES